MAAVKHDRSAVIAIIREKRKIEEAVREEARALIEKVDPGALLVDPEKALRLFFVTAGTRIVQAHAPAARKAGERYVHKLE